MNIGEGIKQQRKAKGITQKQLSKMTGIAEITIRQYEANKYKPKYEQALKIALALGFGSVHDLTNEDYRVITDQEFDNSLSEVTKMFNNDYWKLHDLQNALEGIDDIEDIIIIAEHYRQLNRQGQTEVLRRIEELTHIPQYQKKHNG